MTERITLTAAEVLFLLAAVDPSAQAIVPTLLGIGPEEQTEPVRASGLASLTIRGLVTQEGQDFRLSPEVSAVAEGLTQATTILELGLVSAERADGTVLFDTGEVRFLIAPRPNRCFDVIGLNRQHDIRVPLSQVISGFLTEHRPGVAAVRVEHGVAGAIGQRLATPQTDPTPGFGWVTLAVGADDAWSFADVEEQELRQGDEATAMARFGTVLGTLLSLPAAA